MARSGAATSPPCHPQRSQICPRVPRTGTGSSDPQLPTACRSLNTLHASVKQDEPHRHLQRYPQHLCSCLSGVRKIRAQPLVKQHQLKLPGTQNPVQHQHPGLAALVHGIAMGTWSQCLHRLPSRGAGAGGGNLLLPPSSARTLLVPAPPRCPRASRPQLPGLCRRFFARRCSSPWQPPRAHRDVWQRDEYFMQEHKSTSIIYGSAWGERAATRGRARAASRGTSTSSWRPCPMRAPALLLRPRLAPFHLSLSQVPSNNQSPAPRAPGVAPIPS